MEKWLRATMGDMGYHSSKLQGQAIKQEMVLMKPLKHCIKNSHGLSINKTTEANSPVGDTANRTQTAFHPISIEQWPMTKEKLQAVGQLYVSSCRLNI